MADGGERWTVRRVLEWATADFRGRALDSPRLDAELLLGSVLRCARLDLYTGMDRPLEPAELAAYREAIGRRRRREPVAHIVGEKEFWSLAFEVTPDVLVPRPDTETLVDTALRLGPGARLLDLCTGTGCAAIAIASERPGLAVEAVDLSPAAAAVARRNAVRHGVAERVTVHEGDLYAPLPDGARYSMIVANPPYVPDAEIAVLAAELRREPRQALAGGADGLDVIRRILDGAPRFLAPGGSVLLEVDPRQAAIVAQELGPAALGARGEAVRDLAGSERVVVFRTSAAAD
jgi:release factor glutamine methyltransferase